GLRLGDQVCAFAGVTTGPAVLQRVAQALAASEGKVLQVDILRAQQAMTVSLTPQ
ncbi:26S proteasome non-ATPase regulatory subunit 9, partial [Haematococcus lacustris]